MLHRAGALRAVLELRRIAPMRPRVCILTYHHLADEDRSYPYDDDVADASPAQFRRQMEILARYGTPIGIDELIRALDGGPLPKNPVMVTFDDGYRSCHDVVLPILRAVGVRATFFVATRFINERRLYWVGSESRSRSRTRARRQVATVTYPQPLQLDARDPHAAQEGSTTTIKNTLGLDVDRFVADSSFAAFNVDWNPELEREHADRARDVVGSRPHARARRHRSVESVTTRNHRVLQSSSRRTSCVDELASSRAELEGQLGRRVRAIAYPVGRPVSQHPHIRDAVQAAGYQIGMTSDLGRTVDADEGERGDGADRPVQLAAIAHRSRDVRGDVADPARAPAARVHRSPVENLVCSARHPKIFG